MRSSETKSIPATPPLQQLEGLQHTARGLTHAQRWLLRTMSEYQFGRIENLPVRCGQPVLDPSIKIVRVARLGGQSREAEIPVSEDFELKRAVRDLLDDLERLDNGLVVRLEFKRGLPCLLETTQALALDYGAACGKTQSRDD